MAQEITTGKSQFSVATLLAVTACVAVFCASAIWVVQSDGLGTLTDIPILIVPSIPMMGIGLFAVPIVCLTLVLAMIVLTYCSTPRSLLSLVFFGFVAMAITMNAGWWDNSLRLLFMMTLSAIAMLFETLMRKLPKSQIVAAMLSVCVSFGYYVFLLSAVASAGV